MRVLVPFDGRNPNSRLSPTLSAAERRELADALREDVLDAIRNAGAEPLVVATTDVEASAPVSVDDRSLSTAVNARLEAETPTAVVMADLGLATPRVLSRFFDASGDLVVAPGRGGGTNALVVRHPGFRTDYHGASYRDHLRAAHELGASVREFDSHRLATDVDEPADLAELLLHGDGRATDWLRDAGFELATTDGRVGVERHH